MYMIELSFKVGSPEYGAMYGKIEAKGACDQSRMVQSVRHLYPFLPEEGAGVG